jgi:hypothetical protein
MKRLLLPIVLLVAATATAQQAPIQHTPATCMRADQNTVLTVDLASKGTPRAYFRREGATYWCWVEGTRLGQKATFVLPKFESGPIIEYYFVTVDEHDVVTGKSKEIYRVPSADHCDAVVARHLEYVLTHCEGGIGAVGSALGAGLAIHSATPPVEPSPSTPSQ